MSSGVGDGNGDDDVMAIVGLLKRQPAGSVEGTLDSKL